MTEQPQLSRLVLVRVSESRSLGISVASKAEKTKNDTHDVLLHLPASQLQDPYPGRVALCLQCGSCRCAAHVLWTACMATCLARISFSQTAAVCVVLVVVWR